jgi:hypothetical protein
MKLRRILVLGAPLWSGTALLLSAGIGNPALAGKASRRDFSYQDAPRDGKRCATCRQFTPNDADGGVCAVVEGDVSANGWCLAYSPRST